MRYKNIVSTKIEQLQRELKTLKAFLNTGNRDQIYSTLQKVEEQIEEIDHFIELEGESN